MSPPKRKCDGTKDIRSFFGMKTDQPGHSTGTSTVNSQPGGAAASPTAGCDVRVKEEDGGDSMGHLHRFTMKFDRTACKEYTVDCDHPCTVLEAIQSNDVFKKMSKKRSDENIVIQLGKEDRAAIIATHFPCSCIENGESLIISWKSEKVEEARGTDQDYLSLYPRHQYSVFYIDREGGINTKTKELFRNSAVKQYKCLCVYGVKGKKMAVKDALRNDGRFIDDLGDFNLTDNENPNVLTRCTQRVDNLHGKAFKIRLSLNKRENDEKEQGNSSALDKSQRKSHTKAILDVAQQSGVSVKTAVEKRGDDNTDEVYQLLCEQFPQLKKWMESRFPGDSFQEELKLTKENFGKIQDSFSEVHRISKLIKLGESVCKVIVDDVCQGTGFVLFDNFILTNAHLFKSRVEGEKLQEDTEVFALFNYDEPQPKTKFFIFTAKNTFIDFDEELDYAVLELEPEGQACNIKPKKITVPPGLLKNFGPMPQSGEACLIGHPAGGVKKMDPTCVIEKEKRGQAVEDHLGQYKHDLWVLRLISSVIKGQGIENIMIGGNKAEKVVTYNTFMYHGSSGSPVFDAHGRVFGLHTAGFVYESIYKDKSAIEFAHSVLNIFERFVSKLKESGHEELLKRVEEEAKGNAHLEKVLGAESAPPDEPMEDSSESPGASV